MKIKKGQKQSSLFRSNNTSNSKILMYEKNNKKLKYFVK